MARVECKACQGWRVRFAKGWSVTYDREWC